MADNSCRNGYLGVLQLSDLAACCPTQAVDRMAILAPQEPSDWVHRLSVAANCIDCIANLFSGQVGTGDVIRFDCQLLVASGFQAARILRRPASTFAKAANHMTRGAA